MPHTHPYAKLGGGALDQELFKKKPTPPPQTRDTSVKKTHRPRNRSGCQNITLVITSSDGVPCAHGYASLIATGTLGTDSA
jgi:hypothetical protein